MSVTDSISTANKIQFHYWFSDKSHSMDALVYNKCERELLELCKAIASMVGVSIRMETEPGAKGGLKGWIAVLPKNPKKTPAIKIVSVTALVVTAMYTPVHASITAGISEIIRQLSTKEVPDEMKGSLASEIESLKHELNEAMADVEASSQVKKRRSNFFDLLRKYQKVKSVSLSVASEDRKPLAEEQLIVRDDFKKFILVSGQLKPETIENVAIEIISPVLNKGNFKWKGVYQGAPISFSMKSDEFMALVQSGKVEFKSGTTIQCTLEIERKINSEGQERITSYNIVSVASYLENGKSVETIEGKQQKQKQQISKRQLDLFG